MTRVATFDSTKRPLQEMLGEIDSGKMQLPDFQRSWVWDDTRIKSLLASISAAFPIGAIMLLETGRNALFKPRPIRGTDPRLEDVRPEALVLDGQQRLTALYGPLMQQRPVSTRSDRGRRMKRLYYIDMKMVLDDEADRDEAIISVPEDGVVKGFWQRSVLDLSSREREFAEEHFPLNQIFDSASWRQGYYKYWEYDQEKIERFDSFENEVIKRFEQYQVPIIKLTEETPKEAVCLVFEKVNTGGVVLNVFELLTASFAADNFQLRDDWEARECRFKEAHPVLDNLENDDFLQSVTLLVTKNRRQSSGEGGVSRDRAPAISCKRRDILRLEVEDYERWADRVEEGLVRAARLLHSQKIFRAKDLPYRTQLIPLSAILVELGDLAETEGARQKIARWYWCGVLGELYGGAIETRFARDLPEVVDMVRGGEEPVTIEDASFSPNRLLTLRTRNSAAYKGVYALLMREGCLDFRTGESIEAQTFFDDSIDIHHIFPKAWCRKQGIEAGHYNSIINKTAISARTNRKIGSKPPSEYLKRLKRDAGVGEEALNGILRSHCIDPEKLRTDDFWGFFAARGEQLLRLIERAMGKEITHDQSHFQQASHSDEYDMGAVIWEEQS